MLSAVKRSLDQAGFLTYRPVSHLLTSTELESPMFSHMGTFCGFLGFFFGMQGQDCIDSVFSLKL